MKCLSPLNIRHPSYSSAKIRLVVPCGRCVCCLESRRSEWTLRLSNEEKDHIHTSFLTLTYSDENLKYGRYLPTLCKKDLQDWFKRLRKQIYPNKIRYYAVGEYGTRTLRPHYHVILFGLDKRYIDDGIIEKTWKLGQIHVGQLNRKTIHYCTKYHVNKTDYPDDVEKPFALMSRKPAIGSNYIEKMEHIHDGNLERCYYQDGNFRKKLPRYYRDKLYSAEEREHINEINQIKITKDEQKLIEEHYQTNSINYFEYSNQQKEKIINSYKQKINENNKF